MSILIRRATAYDIGTWLLTLGRERRFRARLLGPARLQPGEAVLDVGCGTGTLAILAKRQVGASGVVAGIDAAEEMIARARHKTQKAGHTIAFDTASAGALPFRDAQFDVVLCTAALHHLPRRMRPAALNEMRRVVKPNGRVLLADFVFGARHSVVGWLHHHHGLTQSELSQLATGAGLRVDEQGDIGMWDMKYIVATPPTS